MSESTPMIQQYRRLKAQVPGCVLFFRLGDFYELFFEDAEAIAPVLGLTLTARHKHSAEPIPMCGVPYHSVGGYITKLGELGYKVAICEQTHPASAEKGLVERKVVRIITPGQPFDGLEVAGESMHYLAACAPFRETWVIGCMDVTSGEFWYAIAPTIESVKAVVLTFGVKECLLPADVTSTVSAHANELIEKGCRVQWCDREFFDNAEGESRLKNQFGVAHLDAFFPVGGEAGVGVCGAVLKYVQLCEPGRALAHIRMCRYFALESQMLLPPTVVQSLELLGSGGGKNSHLGLISMIDGCRTPMGKRLLRKQILSPLLDVSAIRQRLAMQSLFVREERIVREMAQPLAGIGDLERLYGKVCLGRANPKDVWRLSYGFRVAADVMRRLTALPGFATVVDSPAEVEQVAEYALSILVEDPPVDIQEGGVIRPTVDPELTKAVHATDIFTQWKDQYEKQLQQQLNIPSLKIKYNRVFGYGIEVTKAHLHKVPPEFIRRQTMAGGERFVTTELKEQEAVCVSAKSVQVALEEQWFLRVIEVWVAKETHVRIFLENLSQVDVLSGLTDMIVRQGWCYPTMDDSIDIELEKSFHPVVFDILRSSGKHYVTNSIRMRGGKEPLWLISGPNMGGKSTLLRQVAIAVILAQAGCFVPAKSARLGVVDRMFTRIGAGDVQTEGKSTFYVEMQETAYFLVHATERSLVLIDELGRGTSTYDGLSLVWAVCEHLARKVVCRTLCATHFHELAKLADTMGRVVLWHMGAYESEGRIVFDYTLKSGFSARSYGIPVAQLAGVVPDVIRRAQEILALLETKKPQNRQLELM